MSAAGRTTPLSFLAGGGTMGGLMRAHDWSRSSLGEPATWPDLLKSTVATCLASRFPMVIWWGPDLIMLYNDAWQPIRGDTKHPVVSVARGESPGRRLGRSSASNSSAR
jgi:hypothetical protein